MEEEEEPFSESMVATQVDMRQRGRAIPILIPSTSAPHLPRPTRVPPPPPCSPCSKSSTPSTKSAVSSVHSDNSAFYQTRLGLPPRRPDFEQDMSQLTHDRETWMKFEEESSLYHIEDLEVTSNYRGDIMYKNATGKTWTVSELANENLAHTEMIMNLEHGKHTASNIRSMSSSDSLRVQIHVEQAAKDDVQLDKAQINGQYSTPTKKQRNKRNTFGLFSPLASKLLPVTESGRLRTSTGQSRSHESEADMGDTKEQPIRLNASGNHSATHMHRSASNVLPVTESGPRTLIRTTQSSTSDIAMGYTTKERPVLPDPSDNYSPLQASIETMRSAINLCKARHDEIEAARLRQEFDVLDANIAAKKAQTSQPSTVANNKSMIIQPSHSLAIDFEARRRQFAESDRKAKVEWERSEAYQTYMRARYEKLKSERDLGELEVED